MKFLHTMLRVGNLQRSIDFYTQVLGMTLLRQSENPEYQYSLAFLGFEGGNPNQAELELTTTGAPSATTTATPTATLPWACPMRQRPAQKSKPLAATSPARPGRSWAAAP